MEESDRVCTPGTLPLGVHWLGVLSGPIADMDPAWKREITFFAGMESLLPGCPVVNHEFLQQCLGRSPCRDSAFFFLGIVSLV